MVVNDAVEYQQYTGSHYYDQYSYPQAFADHQYGLQNNMMPQYQHINQQNMGNNNHYAQLTAEYQEKLRNIQNSQEILLRQQEYLAEQARKYQDLLANGLVYQNSFDNDLGYGQEDKYHQQFYPENVERTLIFNEKADEGLQISR